MAKENDFLFAPPEKSRHYSRGRLISSAFAALLALLALWAFIIEPRRLVIRETRLTLPSWPAGLKGLRIAVFSDLHAGAPHITLDKIRQIVEKTNATNPDLILLPGDFVIQDVVGGSFIEPESFVLQLKSLRARLGVFATLGNHDWWYNGRRVKKALDSVGIVTLENEAVKIEYNGSALWIGGIGDKWEGDPNITTALAKIDNGASVIVITHNPDIFPSIPAKVSLTIAGHTHGGQVALPVIGRPIVPSEFGERYAAGHIVEGPKHLFVTTGIGTSILPVRFRVPPEISLLTID